MILARTSASGVDSGSAERATRRVNVRSSCRLRTKDAGSSAPVGASPLCAEAVTSSVPSAAQSRTGRALARHFFSLAHQYGSVVVAATLMPSITPDVKMETS